MKIAFVHLAIVVTYILLDYGLILMIDVDLFAIIMLLAQQ